jgi:hypothetical protein
MKKIRTFAAALLAACAASSWGPAHAGDGKWKTGLTFDGDAGYDSNVFKLSSSGKTKLDSGNPSYKTSGRFKDMESNGDLILTPALKLETGNKALQLGFGADYRLYTLNPALSHLSLDFSADKRFTKRSSAVFRSGLVPRRYQRNFMTDATDTTGHVSASERIYKAADYSQWANSLEYRYRFWKRKDGRVGVTGGLLAGYTSRRYNSSFKGRDRNVLRGEASARFALLKGWRARLAYDYRVSDSPVTREVLVLDEAAFGLDLNGNAAATDTNIRTVQPVDRSFKSGTISVGTSFSAGAHTELSLSYKRMARSYTSSQALDPDHRDREDKRSTLRAGLDHRISKGFHFNAAIESVRQDTNRKGDPASTGEVADYASDRVTAGVSYKF